MFQKPVLKNNKYLTLSNEKIIYVLSDVKIKSLFKFKNNSGYMMTLYVPETVNSETIEQLTNLDAKIFETILKESFKWFGKSINDEELLTLYTPSFCKQNSIISVILSNNTLIKSTFHNAVLNDTNDIINILNNKKLLKDCLINITIIHNGLHFYQEQAINKWIIKDINIIDTSVDLCQWIDEDIVEKIKENALSVSKKTKEKIVEYHNKIEQLENNMLCINQKLLSNKNNDEDLKEINKLITFQKDLLI